jgi:hypothetical protein
MNKGNSWRIFHCSLPGGVLKYHVTKLFRLQWWCLIATGSKRMMIIYGPILNSEGGVDVKDIDVGGQRSPCASEVCLLLVLNFSPYVPLRVSLWQPVLVSTVYLDPLSVRSFNLCCNSSEAKTTLIKGQRE